MKMKSTMLLTLFIPLIILHAQTSNEEQIKELNRDIWEPFVKGVNSNNPAMYNAVNSKDFYWVADGTKPRIMNLEEYIEDARLVMNSRTAKGIKSEIEIRFLNRNINHEFASEKCAVRFTAVSPDGKTEVFYSAMQVFSRKENGVWKKWIQYSLTEPDSKEMFEAANPML
jgi:hypothetical protein